MIKKKLYLKFYKRIDFSKDLTKKRNMVCFIIKIPACNCNYRNSDLRNLDYIASPSLPKDESVNHLLTEVKPDWNNIFLI